MFLLIPRCISRFGTGWSNLHSTMFLLILDCLMALSDGSFLFTFHNVSINTCTDLLLPVWKSSFTFHNVSINTETRKQKLRRCYSHLHSTMFLLIQTVRFFPMCHLKRFTFHNVSINTIRTTNSYSMQYNLHSTMFLLIRWHYITILINIVYLHSTMFLLIPMQ